MLIFLGLFLYKLYIINSVGMNYSNQN